MGDFVYEEDEFDQYEDEELDFIDEPNETAQEELTPTPMKNEPEKPGYVKKKKRFSIFKRKDKSKNKKIKTPKKPMFEGKFLTIIVIFVVIGIGVFRACASFGGMADDIFVIALGFSGVNEYNTISQELSEEFNPEISEALNEKLTKFNEEIVKPAKSEFITPNLIGKTGTGENEKYVLELDISGFKAEAEKLELKTPSKIYILFNFTEGSNRLTNVWFNNISETSNEVLYEVFGGYDISRHCAKLFNDWNKKQP